MSFSNFYGPVFEKEAHAILDRCLEAGITHIDTADIYGNGFSEDCIGSYLKSASAEVKAHFSIATKAGIYRSPEGERPSQR